ncbi:MAG: EscE/YscE/SsaE family type III secretion system needle protein co-chaperone [Comamonas sp.]
MKFLLPGAVAQPPEALSPLEEGLRGDAAPAVRAQALARLSDLEQRTRAALAAGAQPERYCQLTALLDACQAAQDVLGNKPSMGANVRLA